MGLKETLLMQQNGPRSEADFAIMLKTEEKN
jgi:hypothetical protein